MKPLLLILLALTLTAVSCGGKDKGGSSSGTFSSALTTQEGYYNLQTRALEFGGQTYPPSQQYQAVMIPALQQATAMNIQPVNVNGVFKYRARVTAQLMNSNNYNTSGYYDSYSGGYNSSYNGGYNPYGSNNTLNITNIQFY